MTARANARTRRAGAWLILAGLALLLPLAGCDPRMAMFFLQPFDPMVPHTGPDLKGKKVVIVAAATAGAQTEFQGIERELVREIVPLLREGVKKIEVVPPQKVWDWVESHPSWTDPSEILKEFEADVVIFLEMEDFRTQDVSSPGLYQGNSKIHVRVSTNDHPKDSRGKPQKDQPKEISVIHDDYTETIFPSRGPIPADSGVSPAAFKNKFLKLVASEVSWHFVDHAPGDDIQDARLGSR